MIAMFVVGLAAAVGPEVAKAEMSLAMRSLERLAAMPTDKPGGTIQEQAARPPMKAERDALLRYLKTTQGVVTSGNARFIDCQNFATVTQQAVMPAKQLAETPEEALCWARAGLDFAAAYHRYVTLQVQAGKFPSQSLYQANAVYEKLQKDYRDSLAELVKNAR